MCSIDKGRGARVMAGHWGADWVGAALTIGRADGWAAGLADGVAPDAAPHEVPGPAG